MIASEDSRLRQIRQIALLLTALALLVVLLSARLRLQGAGLGCADWPACYGRLLSGEPQAQQFGVVRLLHRLFASLSLLLACVLAWLSLRPPSLPSTAGPASWLLALVLALAALGFWSADPRLALVGFLNILGGLGLVSFSWRVVLASSPPARLARTSSASAPTLLLHLGTAALSLTVILGALIGARYAALACTSLPDCAGSWWPTAAGWAAVQPFAVLAGQPSAGEPGGLTLHLLHRWSALSTLLLLGAAALQALAERATRKVAMALLVLLIAQLTLGVLTVLSDFTLALAIAHGVCAAALLASLATLRRASSRTGWPDEPGSYNGPRSG